MDQVATVIPAPQNLEGSFIDRYMYPHGIMDYCNDLMNLHHVIGDSVYPTSTQNSCTVSGDKFCICLSYLL
ncbi:hypothetical protein WN944_000770 [Citrus x changshan-huyou]|uniref:Uncharacterized protein n=1 Tax=Citrus x changshan-huyou TaxID=2935761 RepID=A0AAP0MJU3_9ROSI